MIINNEKKFVYVAIPKTGTYSLHSALGNPDNHPEPHLHHAGIRELLQHYPHIVDYYKFAFVRNPWDKLVSMYHDFTLRRGRAYSAKIVHPNPLLSEFKDFEDFCLNLKTSHWFSDIFFRPQYHSLVTDKGMIMDLVWKFEHMQTGFNAACQQIGLPQKNLGHLNKGQYVGKYRQYYSTRAADAIGDLYEVDIRTFNYAF